MRLNRRVFGDPLSPFQCHTSVPSLASNPLIIVEQFAIRRIKGHSIQGDIVRVFKGCSNAKLANGQDIVLVRVIEVALDTPLVLVCPCHVDSLYVGEGQRPLSRREGEYDAEDKQKKSTTHCVPRKERVC